jgi:hypothetical protein
VDEELFAVSVPVKRSHRAKGRFPLSRSGKARFSENSRRNIGRVNERRKDAIAGRRADAGLWAFSTLISGSSYHSQFAFCSFLGVPVPPSSSFYAAQPAMARILIEMAHQSTTRAAACLPMGDTISFDGAWSHAMRSRQCVGCFIVVSGYRPKIVDYQTSEWYRGMGGNEVQLASQALEGCVFNELARRWKGDCRLRSLVHDQDAKVSLLLRENRWDILELFDKNHVTKGWEKLYNAKACVHTKGAKTKSWPLNVVKPGLLRWWHTCVIAQCGMEERKDMWRGAVGHYRDSEDVALSPEAMAALSDFAESAAQLLEKVQSRFSTQLSECFNSMKAKLASNGLSWKGSWAAR